MQNGKLSKFMIILGYYKIQLGTTQQRGLEGRLIIYLNLFSLTIFQKFYPYHSHSLIIKVAIMIHISTLFERFFG